MQTYCRQDSAAILEEIGRIGLDNCVNEIANGHRLSDRFLLSMGHYLDIFTLSSKIRMSVAVYKKYTNRLNWGSVTKNIRLDIEGLDFLLKNIENITVDIFDRLYDMEVIDCNIIATFVNHFLGQVMMEDVHWDKISQYKHLDSVFLRKYDRYLNWYTVSTFNRSIPVDLIILHSEEMNWKNIWFNYKFNDEDLRTLINAVDEDGCNVDWCSISGNQSLTEDFMNDYKEMLNWEIISEYQLMSYDFLVTHANNINLFHLARNIVTPRDVINKFLHDYNDGNLHPNNPSNPDGDNNRPDDDIPDDNTNIPNNPDSDNNNPSKPDEDEDEDYEWEEF